MAIINLVEFPLARLAPCFVQSIFPLVPLSHLSHALDLAGLGYVLLPFLHQRTNQTHLGPDIDTTASLTLEAISKLGAHLKPSACFPLTSLHES